MVIPDLAGADQINYFIVPWLKTFLLMQGKSAVATYKFTACWWCFQSSDHPAVTSIPGPSTRSLDLRDSGIFKLLQNQSVRKAASRLPEWKYCVFGSKSIVHLHRELPAALLCQCKLHYTRSRSGDQLHCKLLASVEPAGSTAAVSDPTKEVCAALKSQWIALKVE